MTYQLLPEHKVAELALPARKGRRELRIVLARPDAVRGALPDLDVDEEPADGVPSLLEHLLAVDTHVRVLERPVGGADLLEARDARLDQVLGDAQAGLRVNIISGHLGARGDAPGLHVCLAVLLVGGVVELERAEACAGGEEEGDVLDIFDVFLIGVLENAEDVPVAGDFRRMLL